MSLELGTNPPKDLKDSLKWLPMIMPISLPSLVI